MLTERTGDGASARGGPRARHLRASAAARTTTSSSRRAVRKREGRRSDSEIPRFGRRVAHRSAGQMPELRTPVHQPASARRFDLLELCRGRGSGLRLADGGAGAHLRGLAGADREARRTARDDSSTSARRRAAFLPRRRGAAGKPKGASRIAGSRPGERSTTASASGRAASSSSITNRQASTSSRSGTSSSTRPIRVRSSRTAAACSNPAACWSSTTLTSAAGSRASSGAVGCF